MEHENQTSQNGVVETSTSRIEEYRDAKAAYQKHLQETGLVKIVFDRVIDGKVEIFNVLEEDISAVRQDIRYQEVREWGYKFIEAMKIIRLPARRIVIGSPIQLKKYLDQIKKV